MHPSFDTQSIVGLVIWFFCVLYRNINKHFRKKSAKIFIKNRRNLKNKVCESFRARTKSVTILIYAVIRIQNRWIIIIWILEAKINKNFGRKNVFLSWSYPKLTGTSSLFLIFLFFGFLRGVYLPKIFFLPPPLTLTYLMNHIFPPTNQNPIFLSKQKNIHPWIFFNCLLVGLVLLEPPPLAQRANWPARTRFSSKLTIMLVNNSYTFNDRPSVCLSVGLSGYLSVSRFICLFDLSNCAKKSNCILWPILTVLKKFFFLNT